MMSAQIADAEDKVTVPPKSVVITHFDAQALYKTTLYNLHKWLQRYTEKAFPLGVWLPSVRDGECSIHFYKEGSRNTLYGNEPLNNGDFFFEVYFKVDDQRRLKGNYVYLKSFAKHYSFQKTIFEEFERIAVWLESSRR